MAKYNPGAIKRQEAQKNQPHQNKYVDKIGKPKASKACSEKLNELVEKYNG
jgi:hypothetical protein